MSAEDDAVVEPVIPCEMTSETIESIAVKSSSKI
jgi:hypothetical protein